MTTPGRDPLTDETVERLNRWRRYPHTPEFEDLIDGEFVRLSAEQMGAMTGAMLSFIRANDKIADLEGRPRAAEIPGA